MNKTDNYYINKLNLDPVKENAVRNLLKNAGGVNDSTPLVQSLNGDELIPIKQGEDNKTVSVNQIKNKVLELPSKYEFVDLGLPSGTKWATCNVGASKPEEYGLYFAWGETQGYTGITAEKQFGLGDYELCSGSISTLTKYNNNSSYGAIDTLTTLEQVDDVAYQSDKTCRMPTKADFEELTANTTSTWETLNGVNGRRFTSTNGNSIFVPAAGGCSGGSVGNVGSNGYLWSSSLYEGNSWDTWLLGFDSGYMDVGYYKRCHGLTVRAVQSADTPTTINLKELKDKVDNITSYVLITTYYSNGEKLSDEDAAKLSKAFAENIPIIMYVPDSATPRNTMVSDNYNNVYTIIFVLSMEASDPSHGGLVIRMRQLDVDMNTKTISNVKTFYVNDYFLSSTYSPYIYRGTINEEVFNKIKSSANYGCNITWNYKKLNVTSVTDTAVYGFIDDGDSITKYEFTKTAVNVVETKQYSFK